MISPFETEYAAAKCADALMKRDQRQGLWSREPSGLSLGEYRCALMQAFRAGVRHGRAAATRDYMRDLMEEIAARDSWQRLAIGLSKEVEEMQCGPAAAAE